MRGHPSSPGPFPLRVFLFPLVYPPYLSFLSSCFLNPHPFLFLFPTVLFFGLILQLYNFKLFFISTVRLFRAACDNCSVSVFGCVICFLSVWEPPGETESNKQNQNYPQSVQIAVQPTWSDPNGELLPGL